jgi:putative membrane protein
MWSVSSVTHALMVVMLAAAPAAAAQVTSSRDTSMVVDSAYIRQAVRGNYLEVALGRMAESRAEDPSVKDFAERMVSDHNDMNKEWIDLAQDNDMKVTVDFGPDGKQTIDRFEELSGTRFDQAYMSEMIRDHEENLFAFQRLARWAGSAEVRQLASTGASTIQEHLELARQVGSRVGVSSTAGRAGSVPPAPAPSDSDRTRRTTEPEDRGTLSGEDRAFVQNVLQDHLMHVQLAQLARREARQDGTRRLAENMEYEFEGWQQRWANVAERYEVKPPSHLGPDHREKVERLEGASKGNVDRTYIQIVAEHLESVVPYFEKEGQAVQSAAVRGLVNEELPVIRQIVAGVRGIKGETQERAEASERH